MIIDTNCGSEKKNSNFLIDEIRWKFMSFAAGTLDK